MIGKSTLTGLVFFIVYFAHTLSEIAINKAVTLQLEDNSLLYYAGKAGSYGWGSYINLVALLLIILIWGPYLWKKINN